MHFSRTPESKHHGDKGATASAWDRSSRGSRDSASIKDVASSSRDSFRPRSNAGTNYFGDTLGDLGDIASGIAWDIPHLDLDVRNMRLSGINQGQLGADRGGAPRYAAPGSMLAAVQSTQSTDDQDREIDQMRSRLKAKASGDFRDLLLCRMVPRDGHDEQQTRATTSQLEEMVGTAHLEVCRDARTGGIKFWMAFLSESQYIRVKLMPNVRTKRHDLCNVGS